MPRKRSRASDLYMTTSTIFLARRSIVLPTFCCRVRDCWPVTTVALRALASVGGSNASAFSPEIENNRRQFQKALKIRRSALTSKLRMGDLDGAMKEYDLMKESQLPPLKLEMYNEILNKCASLQRQATAAALLRDMEEVGVRPDEGSYCALIRGAVASGDPEAGLALLDDMERAGVKSRLRSYATLLRSASSGQDSKSHSTGFPHFVGPDAITRLVLAIRVWERMRANHILPQEDQIVDMLQTLISYRTEMLEIYAENEIEDGKKSIFDDFSNGDSSNKNTGALSAQAVEALVWAATDELLQDLATITTSITHDSARRIKKILTGCGTKNDRHESAASIVQIVPDTMARSSETAVSQIRGRNVCPCCETPLRLLSLTEAERRHMRTSLLELAATSDIDQRHDLAEFAAWLRRRNGAFTVAVDAANIAYYRQNFAGGHFSFKQIDAVVTALQEDGERPLIIIPRKYLKDSVPNHSANDSHLQPQRRKRQVVTKEDDSIRQRWQDEGIMYTPRFPWADDDWYWMYLTVAHEDPSVGGPVGTVNAAARHASVVTNDETRDHRIGLILDERAFLRWRTTHVRRFDLQPSASKHKDKLRSPKYDKLSSSLTIFPTAPFSRELQRLSCEEGNPNKLIRWHIPIGDVETELFKADSTYGYNPPKVSQRTQRTSQRFQRTGGQPCNIAVNAKQQKQFANVDWLCMKLPLGSMSVTDASSGFTSSLALQVLLDELGKG